MTTNEVIALVIATASLLVAVASARFAWQSAAVSKRQLALVERKIGMVDDPAKMTEILPVWYVERMSTDYWGFGVLLSSGDILAIERINGVSDDHQWMEVTLLERNGNPETVDGQVILYAALKDRRKASVRIDQVQAAFELWTS